MSLNRIRLANFRNHAASELSGTAKFNLLVGENGAGKTNVLEAISLFAPGRGLRRAALADMAAHTGAAGFAVSAELAQGGSAEVVHLGTGTSAERPNRRAARVNGADTSALGLGEWLGCFWLTPAMDRIFTDSAGVRRRFLDRMVLALNPAHAAHAARYERALRERNQLLAAPAEPDPQWLTAIETQMAGSGAAVASGRAALIAALDSALAEMPASPFARPVLALNPGGPAGEAALLAALTDARRRDRAAQRSLVGPHRDELAVTMAAKNQPAADCSTGEQKAMLIAITLAHCEIAAGGDGAPSRPRVLLLDEVAAHLDPLRRAALFERLAATDAQIWLTGTEPAPFADLPGDTARWLVSGGEVERIGVC